MRTVIFRVTAPYITALMLLFSLFVLLRGHNEPAAGFIGGTHRFLGHRGLRHGLRRRRGAPRLALSPAPMAVSV